jgi:predicted transcriptional regulator
MNDYKLAQSEERFAELVWKNEPIVSGELVKICEKELSWKKSTTYTVLKNLCNKGILQNRNTVVTSLVKKEELNARRSRRFVEDTFNGSLPMFLAAFISGKKLSASQIDALKKLIDEHEGSR